MTYAVTVILEETPFLWERLADYLSPHPQQGNKVRELFSGGFRVQHCLWTCEPVGRARSDTWSSLLGPGKEWPPRRRAMPVLFGAGAAQPTVAVGAENVCYPLLLALRAVLEAEGSGVTDNVLIWARVYEWSIL